MAYSIYVGSLTEPDYYFEQKDSFAAKVTQKVALVGKELTIDTFEPVVQDDISNLLDAYHFRSSDGQEIETAVGELFVIDVGTEPRESDLINLEYGTPVWYFRENTLIGKFYISSVDRTARNKYLLRCVSVIGLLEKMQHGGGLFLASTFQVVLSHILASDLHGTGSEVISYEIDPDVAELPVSGWLGKDTKRNNLYKLMFANGVNIVKNIDGEPRFTFIYTAPSNPESIEASEIYDAGTQEYEKPYSKVSITEHTYTPLTDQEPATLYDNTTGGAVSNEEIWFTNAPVIVSTIAASGNLTLVSATENSAIVTGNGKLTGIPYTHTTRMLESIKAGGDSEKTVRVERCEMVNLINSTNLLARLQAYYQPNGLIRTIHNSIVYTTQRVGKAYQFITPFDELETAYLTKMDINASEVFKADCEWRANYEPAGQQGLYDHVDIIVPEPDPEDPEQEITEGDWIVPPGVTEFKVVLISGGTGGGSGWPGKNGKDARTYTNIEETADLSAVWYGAEGGDGGDGGAGGLPGRVKIVTVENATPGATYHWTLGEGGEGGAATGFIKDTVSELRAALENEHPDTSYTDGEIEAMIAQEDSDWNGSPNAGSAGTATTFGSYSTADQDAYVPPGGVYEPITDQYFALPGNGGISGGKGGARKVKVGDTFNWVTDGEDVKGDDGTVYRGGSTGRIMTDVAGLSEAAGKIKAYGGNGAGAAVGIGRDRVSPQTGLLLHPHINGGSDQETSWDVIVDSEWIPPTPTPSPTPVPPPEPPPGAPALSATLVADKTSVSIGETITWTMTASGGNGEYSYFFTVYRDGSIVESPGVWQQSPSCTWRVEDYGKYTVAGYVTDSRDIEVVQAAQGGQVEAPYIEPLPPYTTEGLYAKIGDRRSGRIAQLSSGVYGPMGEGTGVGPITPVKSNGEEIVIDSHLDFEINVVFKFESAFPDIPHLYPNIFNVWGKVVDEDPDVINPENEAWYLPHMDVTLNGFDTHGTINITASLISDLSSLYDGRKFIGIDVWQNVFGEWGTALQLNAWYKMNVKKIGDDYYFVATKPDGSEYVGKDPNPHTRPLSFKGTGVVYFGSDSADKYSCNGVCYDLSQCYIKQSGRRIWGVPE